MRAIPFDTSVSAECSNTASPVQRPPPDLPSEEETRPQHADMTRDMDPSTNSLHDLEGLEMSLNGVLLEPTASWYPSSFGDPGDLNGQLLPAASSPLGQNPVQGHGQQNAVQPLPPLSDIYGYPQTTNPYDFHPSETHHVQPQPQPPMQSYDAYYGSSPADIKPTPEELLGFRQRTDSIQSVTSSCSNYEPSSGFEPQPGTSHDHPRGRVRVRSEQSVGSENDDEIRRKRRRERNKVAAAKCREKKRNQQTQLVREHATVRQENQRMQRELEELRAEVHHLQEKLRTHACCLTAAPVAYSDQNQQWSSWGGTPMG